MFEKDRGVYMVAKNPLKVKKRVMVQLFLTIRIFLAQNLVFVTQPRLIIKYEYNPKGRNSREGGRAAMDVSTLNISGYPQLTLRVAP